MPGLWIAPFIAAPASELALAHPEWLAREADDPTKPMIGMFNDIWGGFMYGLDVTRPEVLDHLAQVAADLVDAGYHYLKLDFTFSAKQQGRYADATLTPAERVRGAYEAIRRGAGEDTFILGCGAPLGSLVGVVDGMRIGPDVGPHWTTDPLTAPLPGYRETQPSTRGAWRSTLARAFLHRQLWLNDPDCLMLRPSETHLTTEQARTWALAVGVSGGMALVSDDLALLGPGRAGPARRGPRPGPSVRRRGPGRRAAADPGPARRPDPRRPGGCRPHPRRRSRTRLRLADLIPTASSAVIRPRGGPRRG